VPPNPKKAATATGKTKKGANDESHSSRFDRQDVIDNPRIFVFVIGGLSHHEIVSIANLQETLNAQIIPGGNEIIKPADLMSQLEKLHKKETDLAFVKSLNSRDKDEGKQRKEEDDDNEETADDDTYAINA
jgi:hypothetical protein